MATLAPAPIGHNMPPITPYEALKAHIDDLEMEATNFLDGEPIKTETQAEAIAKIREDARKARQAAEEQRKLEAKPFDEGKKAVQALWTPLTDEKKGRCALIEETCKKALAPYLLAKDEAQRAAADALRKEAEEKAAAAAKLAEDISPDNLAGQSYLRAARDEAASIGKEAETASKARAHVHGASRATGLRSVWTPTLTDARAALKHYRERQPDELKAWLLEQAFRDVRAGARAIPGFIVNETKGAV
jgi:hypothetical protein